MSKDKTDSTLKNVIRNAADVADTAASAVFPIYGLAKTAYKYAEKALNSSDALEHETTPELCEEAERKELEQRIKQAEAKIAQEYAIAARIQLAKVVEIEEHYEYDATCEGGVNLNANLLAQEGGLGISGRGETRRVSRRIYRFTGAIAIPEDNQNSSG